jgi:hypothetical protein
MNLAVVLVSDQTIPNVVYLKNIREKWDKVLFVSTKGMESPKKIRVGLFCRQSVKLNMMF